VRPMSGTLVVGVDAGGTTTRCLVATLDGAVVARGETGGASQRSSTDRPADPLAAALRSALSGVDSRLVAGGVIGAAGAGPAGRTVAQDAATTAWRSVGLPGDVTLVTDLEVAFFAGTALDTGLLLLAGTGAVAAAFRDGAVRRRCDGYGWLLGDEGSAVWIGREGLRGVLAALDGRGEPTSLTPAVSALLLGEDSMASDREARASPCRRRVRDAAGPTGSAGATRQHRGGRRRSGGARNHRRDNGPARPRTGHGRPRSVRARGRGPGRLGAAVVGSGIGRGPRPRTGTVRRRAGACP
jgi:hypothetical protein